MKKLPLIGILALFAVVILIGSVLFSLTGFTTLGLTKAEFKSSATLPNGDFWNRDLWILHISQDGFAQRASGAFYEGEIGIESGTAPQQAFYVEMDFERQSCEYPLFKESGVPPLSDFNFVSWSTLSCSEAEAMVQCPNMVDGAWSPIPIPFPGCWCIDESTVATTVDINIESPFTHTVSTIIVGNDDGWEQVFNVDTHESETISGYVVPDRIYARWTGYHGTDFQCDDSDEIYGFWSLDGFSGGLSGSWKTGLAESYRTYQQKYNSLPITIQNAINDLEPDETVTRVQNIVSDMNSARQEAMVETAFGQIEGPGGVDITDSRIVKDIPSPIKYPQYVMYIDAEYLGIEVLPPDIKVISAVMADEFITGDGIIQITLRNDGHDGSAYVSIEDCSPGFSGSPARLVGLDSGETKTITRSISADVTQETTGTCTTVSNDGFQVSRLGFAVKARPFTSCTPGETKCFSDDTIKTCNSVGTGWETVEDCTASCNNGYCEVQNGVPVCGCPGGNGGGITCPPIMLFGFIPFPDLLCLLEEALKGVIEAILWVILIALAIVFILTVIIVLMFRWLGGK